MVLDYTYDDYEGALSGRRAKSSLLTASRMDPGQVLR
jgi:hypothetical protein